jgi:hypothetical protein
LRYEIFRKFAESDCFQWIGKASAAGTLQEVLGNLGTTILSVMKLVGLQNMVAVDRTWIRAYGVHFRTKEDCKGASDTFPSISSLESGPDSIPMARSTSNRLGESPRCLLTGYKTERSSLRSPSVTSVKRSSKGSIVELENAGHYCQENAPAMLVALIEQFNELT